MISGGGAGGGGRVIIGAGTCVMVTGGTVGVATATSLTVKLAIADQLPSTGASGLTAQKYVLPYSSGVTRA